jgi:hypothetical protein
MKTALRNVVMLAATLLLSVPGTAAALTFAEAPGSPYQTTEKHWTPSPGGILGGAVAGDFNGDGISDLAVVNGMGLPAFSPGESVSILLGHPDGELTLAPGSPVELYSGGMFSSDGPIATGEFTHDGHLDLAVVDNVHDTVSILLGDGTGRFRLSGASVPFSGGEPQNIAVGDFSGDGNEDLAFASGGKVNVLLGDGAGGFAPAPGSPFATPGYAGAIAAGNFNGDGRSDLAVGIGAGQVAIYLATGEGRFQEAPGLPLAAGESSDSIVAADVNHDGRTDLAITSGVADAVTVLLGNGTGGFTPAPGSPFAVPGGPGSSPSSPGSPDSIAAGDFNGDGNVDLAVANFNGSSDNVAVLQGDGHGGFTNAAGSPFPVGGNPRPVIVGDFNGDGRPDLAVVNSFQGVVTVLENTTVGAHEEPVPHEEPTRLRSTKDFPGYHGTSSAPTPAEILGLVIQQLEPGGSGAGLRLPAGSRSLAYLYRALEAGTATVNWYASAPNRRRARGAHTRLVLVASGTVVFSGAGTKTMRILLTRAGVRLWRQARGLRLTVRGTFTPIGAAPIAASRTATLKR